MPAIALLSGTASRSRASRALRLRSPRETPLRSDTDVLLLHVGSEPEQRIRRTSSRLRPTRKTTYYAADSAIHRNLVVSVRERLSLGGEPIQIADVPHRGSGPGGANPLPSVGGGLVGGRAHPRRSGVTDWRVTASPDGCRYE